MASSMGYARSHNAVYVFNSFICPLLVPHVLIYCVNAGLPEKLESIARLALLRAIILIKERLKIQQKFHQEVWFLVP